MKHGILIDLTSLLDVILILMYLVLVNASMKVENAEAKALDGSALAMRVKELQEENETLSRKANTVLTVEQNCFVLTVCLSKNEGSLRAVTVDSKAEGTVRFDLKWEDRQYIENVLKTEIGRRIKLAFDNSYQAAFIVFQYDRNTIYESDYKLISSVIQAEKANKNVYCAEYDSSGG
jgi:biopolymer transport protein ExbD